VLPGVIDVQPPSGIGIGALTVGFYGIGYVVAIVVLVWTSQGEARRRGIDPSLVTGAVVTIAICALVGARLYHVIDDWDVYAAEPVRIVLPPYSGLGLYGGIAGAVVGIAIAARRNGVPLWTALDIAVPGTLFAQAIARWGNFFNQELYGPPSDVPWAITIGCEHRVAQWPCGAEFPVGTGFHPLFLYESVLDVMGGAIALWVSRRSGWSLRPGDLASFWAIWYGTTRTVLETLFRSDWAWRVGGVPTASVIGVLLVLAGVATLVSRHSRPQGPAPTPIAG
jgi:phosphatidylglycerol:prolipoprotein diacylglycerol transferase